MYVYVMYILYVYTVQEKRIKIRAGAFENWQNQSPVHRGISKISNSDIKFSMLPDDTFRQDVHDNGNVERKFHKYCSISANRTCYYT
jgi:hypothetical protein